MALNYKRYKIPEFPITEYEFISPEMFDYFMKSNKVVNIENYLTLFKNEGNLEVVEYIEAYQRNAKDIVEKYRNLAKYVPPENTDSKRIASIRILNQLKVFDNSKKINLWGEVFSINELISLLRDEKFLRDEVQQIIDQCVKMIAED